jgi:glyoxylase-like metal-dependent hydrolase (beta-lactamase superfamily II)
MHAAWRSKPSFYAVSTEDRTINPDLERFMAKRMGAKTIEVKASHLSLISQPDEITNKVSPALKLFVTQPNLKLASPRLRQIKAAAEVVPGVTTFDTAGHTPGHISVDISSGSEEMLLTGDVVVNSAVSFLHPEWPVRVRHGRATGN